MNTPDEWRHAAQAAIATAARISREGGVAQIEMPDPETGELAIIEIDQPRARELLTWLLDSLASNLWKQVRDGQLLSPTDREFLTTWTAATVAESEAAERERRIASAQKRAQLYLIRGDKL